MSLSNIEGLSLVDLLSDLVRINSVNPSFELGHSEADVVDYLERFCQELGIETWKQEVFPGRSNLIAHVPGRDPSRKLIFEAHTDTVSAGGMTIPPFDPIIADGRLYGRGSCDDKAGLAAMMYAAASLKQASLKPPCDILVVAAADEEFSFGGVRRFLQEGTATAAVVAEPTGLQIAIASKGVLRWKIRCSGIAAHSSKPETGLNAITNMTQVICGLEREMAKIKDHGHPLLGRPTLNVGTIEGGRQINIVPDFCTIQLDRRLLPGERASEVLAHYRASIPSSLRAEFESPMLEDEAFETSSESEIVKCAVRVLRHLQMDHAPIGVPFGTDASKLSRAGIPSIIVGPGSIDQAHSAVEYVEIAQLERATEVYRDLMLAFGEQ